MLTDRGGEWQRATFARSASLRASFAYFPPNVPFQRPATKSLRRSLYEEATRIVDDEYASDLELDEIARRVASSRRQIQRVFAEVGHTTFREHLARVRMDRAAELLSSGAPTVREVAARVGYRQPAQFAKAFRRHRGQAPAAYRAQRMRARNGATPVA